MMFRTRSLLAGLCASFLFVAANGCNDSKPATSEKLKDKMEDGKMKDKMEGKMEDGKMKDKMEGKMKMEDGKMKDKMEK